MESRVRMTVPVWQCGRRGSRGKEERETYKEHDKELSGWGRRPRVSAAWSSGSKKPKRALQVPGERRALSEPKGRAHGAPFFPIRFWKVMERSQVSPTCFQGLGEPTWAFPGWNRENTTTLTGSGADGASVAMVTNGHRNQSSITTHLISLPSHGGPSLLKVI